jgi:dTDP-glucose pyrophosphorylase
VRIELQNVLVAPELSIKEVMACIDRSSAGIALVVDADRRLVGTVTDGDIRRGLLRGLALDAPVEQVVNRNPLVVPETFAAEAVIGLMQANDVRHMPLVDESRCVTGLEVLALPIPDAQESPTAVLMAGGEGVRLRPMTENMPKSMLKVGGRPLLEIILETLRAAGFHRVFINIRYLGHIIESHFEDGSKWNVSIHYLREPKRLGTAGGLALIPKHMRPGTPFVVINADILTRLNFAVLRDFHIAANYDLTLCGWPYEVRIPFGYPVVNGDLVTDFKEKPTITHLVNSGIYCLNPELLDEVPVNEPYDMPDLIRRACARGLRVGVFPLREAFHEIGRVESYAAAEKFYRQHFAIAHEAGS